jgi:hypothetical protein
MYINAFRERYDLYGADEFGTVLGEFEMKAEIFERGPIACLLNSEAPQFNLYTGGIIKCDKDKATAGNSTEGCIIHLFSSS